MMRVDIAATMTTDPMSCVSWSDDFFCIIFALLQFIPEADGLFSVGSFPLMVPLSFTFSLVIANHESSDRVESCARSGKAKDLVYLHRLRFITGTHE